MINEGILPRKCPSCTGSRRAKCAGEYWNRDLTCPICEDDQGKPCPYCKSTRSLPIYGCPEKLISSDAWLTIELYTHYQNHFLPEQGGVLDQCAKTMRAINFVAKEMGEADEEKELHKMKNIPAPGQL